MNCYSNAVPRDLVSIQIHHTPRFPGRQQPLLGNWGEEGHRTWPGQDLHGAGLQKFPDPTEKCLVWPYVYQAAYSPFPFVIQSSWQPPPRINPSSELCTHICSHTSLTSLGPENHFVSLFAALIIPRLNQGKAEGHVQSLYITVPFGRQSVP